MVREWPEWWEWELDLTAHLLKRMLDRQFTEIDLRRMLEHARDLRVDIVEGRWVVVTRHAGSPWEVVVEPDLEERILIVVTAYPVEGLLR